MKTLRLLLKVLATYIASKCFRKIIETEIISEELFLQTLTNHDRDVFLHIWQIGLGRDIQQKILSGYGKKIYVRNFIKETTKKGKSKLYQRDFRIVKYLLNKELTLCSLEMVEKIYVSIENPIVYFNQFQYVE